MNERELPCKVEIRPVNSTETHIFVNGKEIHHIRKYSIKQKAGYLPIVEIELNGANASYDIDTSGIRIAQPNIFRELWYKLNDFMIKNGFKKLRITPLKNKKMILEKK